jgi:hypothetical protein
MSATALDVSIVAALAEIATRHGLSELEVDHGGLRIRIARERHRAAPAHVIAAPTQPQRRSLTSILAWSNRRSPAPPTCAPEPDAAIRRDRCR